MMKNIFPKKAFSIIEYTMLIAIVLGALLIFRDYAQRAVYGQWQKTGEAFAFGRQYDRQKSIECGVDQFNVDGMTENIWYNANCLENALNAEDCAPDNTDCIVKILTGGNYLCTSGCGPIAQ